MAKNTQPQNATAEQNATAQNTNTTNTNTDTNTTEQNAVAFIITAEQKAVLAEHTNATAKAKVSIRLTDTNKFLSLTAPAQRLFKAQGLQVNKNGYYNYNTDKVLWQNIYDIVKANTELFYISE